MKTTYLVCKHGNEKRFGCQQCEKEKISYKTQFLTSVKESKITPIYRSCKNQTCFCDGSCKEVIGYTEKDQNENTGI